MTACMEHIYCNGESGNSQMAIFLVHKTTFKQIVKVLLHLDNLFECNFAEAFVLCVKRVLYVLHD